MDLDIGDRSRARVIVDPRLAKSDLVVRISPTYPDLEKEVVATANSVSSLRSRGWIDKQKGEKVGEEGVAEKQAYSLVSPRSYSYIIYDGHIRTTSFVFFFLFFSFFFFFPFISRNNYASVGKTRVKRKHG